MKNVFVNKSYEKKVSILVSSIHIGLIVLILNRVSNWFITHLKMDFELNWLSFNKRVKNEPFYRFY